MLFIDKLRLYTQTVTGFRIRQDPKDPHMVIYMSENSDIIHDLPYLKFKRSDLRYSVQPYMKRPLTYLTSKLRKFFKSNGYFAYSSKQQIPIPVNILYDISYYQRIVHEKYRFKTYRTRGKFFVDDSISKAMEYKPSYKKILLYTVDLEKPIPSILNRKIWGILCDLKHDIVPFDYFVLGLISNGMIQYRLLTKGDKYNYSRIFTILKTLKFHSPDEIAAQASEEIVDQKLPEPEETKHPENPVNLPAVQPHIFTPIPPEKQLGLTPEQKKAEEPREKFKDSISNFIKNDPTTLSKIRNDDMSHEDKRDTFISSILYKLSGNMKRSKMITKNIPSSEKNITLQKLQQQYKDEILPDENVSIKSTNVAEKKLYDIKKLVDNVSPDRIFNKRKVDFQTNLKKDIKNVLIEFEKADLPLYTKSMVIVDKKVSKSELYPSDISEVNITMHDGKNKEFNVSFNIPKINDDGTFNIRGNRKCLINQLVLNPISFLKPHDSKFESSYSVFHIWSKITKNEKRLEIFLGSYKISYMIFLSYVFGFDRTLKNFGIKYEITKDKEKLKDQKFTKLNQDEFIIFYPKDNEFERQLIQSFIRYDFSTYKTLDKTERFSKDYFANFIIENTGYVNSTYLIDNIVRFIVDPVCKQVLINKQLPFELEGITHYMAQKAVEGFTQKRNDISFQRVRNSEIIIQLMRKQFLSAYTEYREQVLSGSSTPELNIQKDKVLSNFLVSQIVADMEYANPAEELSVLTRVTPVGAGVGGIPDSGAITSEGRDIHLSMYGNIDPLDTPEGGNVGIVQHLTLGAMLSTSRGLFLNKDFKDGENSGMLSTTTCLTPFIENCDGPRIMFAANQARQSVPLKNPEPPIIQTGYESILSNFVSESFAKKSPVDGTITSITKAEMVVKDHQGKSYKIDTTPSHLRSGSGKNTLSIFETKNKVGDKVSSGQIISEGSCMSKGSLALGRTLHIAIMPYKGFNFEDGIVISESLAKSQKLTSIHGVEKEVVLKANDKLTYIVNEGDHVEKGQPLLRKKVGDVLDILGQTDEEETDIIDGDVVEKSPGGVIVEIEVFCNTNPDKFPILSQYIQKTNKKYQHDPKKKYTAMGDNFVGVLIRFKVEQELHIGVGDKLTNRYGAKGIVSLIEKDEFMPISPFGKVDIITNPIGIIGRMNPGQVFELYVGLISKTLGDFLIKVKTKEKFLPVISKVLTELDMTKNKEYSKIFTTRLISLSSSDYDKFYSEIESTGFFPIIVPPFKAPSYPQIINVLKMLGLPMGYHLKLPEYGLNTHDKIPVGFMYFMKLEHIATEKMHSRSTGPVVGKTLQPTGGKSREGGQRMGELDTYCFASRNALKTLDEFFGPLSEDSKTKNEIISDIIQTGKADYRKSRSKPGLDLLNAYTIAMMLGKD